MDAHIESAFLNDFVEPRKRTRLLWELERPNRRADCLMRLRTWLLPDRARILKSITNDGDVCAALRKAGADGVGYLIAEEHDQSRPVTMDVGVAACMGSMTRILYFPRAHIAFFDDEDFRKIILQ